MKLKHILSMLLWLITGHSISLLLFVIFSPEAILLILLTPMMMFPAILFLYTLGRQGFAAWKGILLYSVLTGVSWSVLLGASILNEPGVEIGGVLIAALSGSLNWVTTLILVGFMIQMQFRGIHTDNLQPPKHASKRVFLYYVATMVIGYFLLWTWIIVMP